MSTTLPDPNDDHDEDWDKDLPMQPEHPDPIPEHVETGGAAGTEPTTEDVELPDGDRDEDDDDESFDR